MYQGMQQYPSYNNQQNVHGSYSQGQNQGNQKSIINTMGIVHKIHGLENNFNLMVDQIHLEKGQTQMMRSRDI